MINKVFLSTSQFQLKSKIYQDSNPFILGLALIYNPAASAAKRNVFILSY